MALTYCMSNVYAARYIEFVSPLSQDTIQPNDLHYVSSNYCAHSDDKTHIQYYGTKHNRLPNIERRPKF